MIKPDNKKLKSILVLNDIEVPQIAEKIDRSITTVYAKLRGDASWLVEEAYQVKKLVNEKDKDNQWTIEKLFF